MELPNDLPSLNLNKKDDVDTASLDETLDENLSEDEINEWDEEEKGGAQADYGPPRADTSFETFCSRV